MLGALRIGVVRLSVGVGNSGARALSVGAVDTKKAVVSKENKHHIIKAPVAHGSSIVDVKSGENNNQTKEQKIWDIERIKYQELLKNNVPSDIE